MDVFGTNLQPILLVEGVLDASQDAPLVELHEGNGGHEVDAEAALVWTVQMRSSDFDAAPEAVTAVKVVTGNLDVWWWDVFDGAEFDAGRGFYLGATSGAARVMTMISLGSGMSRVALRWPDRAPCRPGVLPCQRRF